MPWVSSKEVKAPRLSSSTYSVTQKAIDETGLRVCPPGSVLVVVRSGILAHTLPVTVTEIPVTVNQDLKAFFSEEPLLNEWLALFLRMSAHELLASSRRDGTTVQSVQYPLLKNTLIPVPPLDERRLIIEAVDTALAKQASIPPRLTVARRAIERFRLAVLAAASSGRLTADWREENETAESGVQLLRAIRTARVGVPKALEPEEIAKPDIEETPAIWAWVKFGSVIGELRNGVSVAPAMEPPGIPILRISAVRSQKVDLNDLRFLRDELDKWMSFTLRDGDLLFTRYNGSISLLGVCGAVRGVGDRIVLHPDKLMRVRFDHDLILPEYVEIFFSAPSARGRMTAGSVSSAGQQGISGTTVKAQPLAVPPVAEQKEIVRRVATLFHLADGLQQRIDTATARIDRTSPAVLAKAFRGELVKIPADPVGGEGSVATVRGG
jgi:type I restriction enzyme S subunit